MSQRSGPAVEPLAVTLWDVGHQRYGVGLGYGPVEATRGMDPCRRFVDRARAKGNGLEEPGPRRAELELELGQAKRVVVRVLFLGPVDVERAAARERPRARPAQDPHERHVGVPPCRPTMSQSPENTTIRGRREALLPAEDAVRHAATVTARRIRHQMRHLAG